MKKKKLPVKAKAIAEDIKHPQGDHYPASMHPTFPPPQDVQGGDMQFEPPSGMVP